jgi:VanZ family protein
LIEIAQSFCTSNRVGSLEDALANAIGAAAGLVIFSGLKFAFRKGIFPKN